MPINASFLSKSFSIFLSRNKPSEHPLGCFSHHWTQNTCPITMALYIFTWIFNQRCYNNYRKLPLRWFWMYVCSKLPTYQLFYFLIYNFPKCSSPSKQYLGKLLHYFLNDWHVNGEFITSWQAAYGSSLAVKEFNFWSIVKECFVLI